MNNSISIKDFIGYNKVIKGMFDRFCGFNTM